MRLAKSLVAVLAPLIVAGLLQGCQTNTRSDCDIAADMITYRKTAGQDIGENQNIDDPAPTLKKYDAWLVEVQKDADDIKDPNIKQRAQSVVDADKAFIGYHRGKLEHPEQPDFPPNEAKIDEMIRRANALADAQVSAAKQLQQACPAIQI